MVGPSFHPTISRLSPHGNPLRLHELCARTIFQRRLTESALQHSNCHTDLIGRDRKHVLGWRYSPQVVFQAGKGAKLIDVDGNEYYDLTSGMMCLVLGHAHPELVETIKEQSEHFIHQSSWYSNPWIIEFAELLASTLPGDLSVVNFTVTGSEANEVAMRMALGVTGRYDIVSVIRGLHGGSLAAESVTTVGGAQAQPRAFDDPVPSQRHSASILLPLPDQPGVPLLRRRLSALERADNGIRHQPGRGGDPG